MAGVPNPDIRQTFDSAYADRAPVFGAQVDEVVTRAARELPAGAYILDLGAGDGRHSLPLLEQGFSVKAVDFAPSGIAHLEREAAAKGVAERLTTEVADIREVALERDAFDGIVSTTVLENLTKQEQLTLMDRLRLACRTGGVMALECHSDRDPAATGEDGASSEFSGTIVSPVGRNELLGYFATWRILYYDDDLWTDVSHGEPHQHGWVGIVAKNTRELRPARNR